MTRPASPKLFKLDIQRAAVRTAFSIPTAAWERPEVPGRTPKIPSGRLRRDDIDYHVDQALHRKNKCRYIVEAKVDTVWMDQSVGTINARRYLSRLEVNYGHEHLAVYIEEVTERDNSPI